MADVQETPRIPTSLTVELESDPRCKLVVQLSGREPDPQIPVLFFMAGFPDDHDTWAALAPRFTGTHTVAICCWPGFEVKDHTLGGGGLAKQFGFTHAQVVAVVAQALRTVSPQAPVTFIAHDWGCYTMYGVVRAHPELVRTVVAIDVGLFIGNSPSLCTVLIILCYQLWFVLAFLICQAVPCRLCSAIGDITLGVFPHRLLGPCPYERKVPRRMREVHAWMCYPYFHLYWGMLTGALPPLCFPPSRGIPLLYVYGARKRVLFHSPGFLRSIEAAGEKGDGSRYHGFPGCGHWVQTQEPDALESEIRSFINEAKPGIAASKLVAQASEMQKAKVKKKTKGK